MQKHWGKWVEMRARHIGLQGRSELQRAVGIGRRQLHTWLKSESPPEMRAINEALLARALRVESYRLFNEWHETEPDKLPIVGPKAPNSRDTGSSDVASIRREIHGIVQALDEEQLSDVLFSARQAMAKHLEQVTVDPEMVEHVVLQGSEQWKVKDVTKKKSVAARKTGKLTNRYPKKP